MTLAMAFFSIALTLNLTGIKLSEIQASDLRPSRLRANLTRHYYSTNEQVMKYYENLRLVYEMEARVRELRRSTEAEPAQAPRETPKQAPRDGTGSPSSPSSTAPAGPAVPQGRQLQGHRKLPCRWQPVLTAQEEEKYEERFSGLCGQQLKTKRRGAWYELREPS